MFVIPRFLTEAQLTIKCFVSFNVQRNIRQIPAEGCATKTRGWKRPKGNDQESQRKTFHSICPFNWLEEGRQGPCCLLRST